MLRRRMTDGLRWAFRCGSWIPDSSEWILAAQYVQPEEKHRIGQFVFKRDAKSSMAGRLLIRKAISEGLCLNYRSVRLGRTEKGKPFLEGGPDDSKFSFNVSHQGEYAVLAAETRYDVGVDVMKTEMPRGKTLSEYFHTMRRQLTEEEWSAIRSHPTEREQMETFYRFWCLKESHVKALGLGIGFTLSRLNFRLATPKLPDVTHDDVIRDTKLYVDGTLAEDWTFEESKLDDDHMVAVALTPLSKELITEGAAPGARFRELTFGDLTENACPISDPDPQYWAAFNAKEEKPPGFR